MKTLIVALAGAALAGGSAPAVAAAAPPATAALPEVVAKLAKCRAEPDDARRLGCYDAASRVLTAALDQGQIVVVDQETARKTRRSLFGFNLPKLPLFAGDRSAEDGADEINAKIASARALPNGRWQLKIDDGAIWETTEAASVQSDPRAGNSIIIRRGPLGSYMVRVSGERALRAKRVG